MFLSDKWVKERGDYDKNEIVFMYISIYLFSSRLSHLLNNGIDKSHFLSSPI